MPHPFVHTVMVDASRALASVAEWGLDIVDGHVLESTMSTLVMNTAFAACVAQAHHMGTLIRS